MSSTSRLSSDPFSGVFGSRRGKPVTAGLDQASPSAAARNAGERLVKLALDGELSEPLHALCHYAAGPGALTSPVKHIRDAVRLRVWNEAMRVEAAGIRRLLELLGAPCRRSKAVVVLGGDGAHLTRVAAERDELQEDDRTVCGLRAPGAKVDAPMGGWTYLEALGLRRCQRCDDQHGEFPEAADPHAFFPEPARAAVALAGGIRGLDRDLAAAYRSGEAARLAVLALGRRAVRDGFADEFGRTAGRSRETAVRRVLGATLHRQLGAQLGVNLSGLLRAEDWAALVALAGQAPAGELGVGSSRQSMAVELELLLLARA